MMLGIATRGWKRKSIYAESVQKLIQARRAASDLLRRWGVKLSQAEVDDMTPSTKAEVRHDHASLTVCGLIANDKSCAARRDITPDALQAHAPSRHHRATGASEAHVQLLLPGPDRLVDLGEVRERAKGSVPSLFFLETTGKQLPEVTGWVFMTLVGMLPAALGTTNRAPLEDAAEAVG